MPWFKIYAGLGGSFGGAKYHCTEEYADKEQAGDAAFEAACEEYERYEGRSGLRTFGQILQEDDVDEDEAYEQYREERDRWLNYYAVETAEPNEEC